MSLQQFVDWFEGFSENIEGDSLTPKQWQTLKSRLLALKSVAAMAEQQGNRNGAVQPVLAEPGVDPNPAGTGTTAWWKKQVAGLLADVYEAGDIPKIMKDFPVDLNATPQQAFDKFIAST
jgi:hypothetical protein